MCRHINFSFSYFSLWVGFVLKKYTPNSNYIAVLTMETKLSIYLLFEDTEDANMLIIYKLAATISRHLNTCTFLHITQYNKTPSRRETCQGRWDQIQTKWTFLLLDSQNDWIASSWTERQARQQTSKNNFSKVHSHFVCLYVMFGLRNNSTGTANNNIRRNLRFFFLILFC